ncbi:MAG TPA: POTRA domain-containing protein [Acidobacteriaceae bacterium]|jgi:outer membrane protein insertion porin family|nr:POTRA domain-containing protein [Acidobacteriaceae bacterium]
MILLRPCFALLLTGALLVSSAVAQKTVPKRITFSGSTISQRDLLAVTGLKPGLPLGQADVQAAAQRLADTGMFSGVQFTFDGVNLNYILKPAEGLEPVSYANFPWWDERTLTAVVAAKVPLFHGEVPPESAMQQHVAAALTALLAEKGVTATVSGVPATTLVGGKGIEYHIDAPPVEVGSVHLADVSAAWAEPVLAVQKAEVGQDFDPATEETLATALRAMYHRQGFLEMAMTHYEHGEPQVLDGKILVPVSTTVVEGPQYRVRTMEFAGDVVITPEQFAKMAQLHMSDVANEDLLHGTVAEMTQAYKSHGYLRVKVDATPKLDAATRTVDYAFSVVPGPVFTMGTLGLANASDVQRAEVMKAWPLREDDVYDEGLVEQFLVRYKNQLHSLDGWSASFRGYEHEDSHVVDLVVTFHRGGPLR